VKRISVMLIEVERNSINVTEIQGVCSPRFQQPASIREVQKPSSG